MKQITLLFFLLLSLCVPTFAQNNIKKTAAIAYTQGPPTFTPGFAASTEIAIDTVTGKIYEYHRTTSTWLQLGQGIDVISGAVPPAYTPARNQSHFAINADNELYYYDGATWQHINVGGGPGAVTIDTFSLSGTTLSLSISDDAEPAKTVSFSGWDTDASDDLTGSGTAPRVALWNGSQALSSSSTLTYQTNTMSFLPAAKDTIIYILGESNNYFGISTMVDTFNGAATAYKIGALNRSGRVYLSSYETYLQGPLRSVEATGIGFKGSTGSMYLHPNGDQYTATTTGDNQTQIRNLHWYFLSGGINYGNPVVFQQVFANNDSTGNSFEFLARNTAGGGITIPDSTLLRVGNWDHGTALEVKHGGKIGIDTRTPTQQLDVNGNARVRGLRFEDHNDITGTGTVTGSTSITDNLYKNGSTQATLTFNLPATPTDGQICTVCFDDVITALTIDGNGTTLSGTLPTTAAVGDCFAFKYYLSITAWIRTK